MADIIVPEVGESIAEGILVEWKVENGAVVDVDDPLFVLETDKITLDVPSENAGLVAIGMEPGDTVRVGQVVGTIDTSVEPAPAEEGDADGGPPKETPAGMPQAVAKIEAASGLAPSVRRLVAEHGLDARKITGTGKAGRIIKADVIGHIESSRKPAATKPAAPKPAAPKPAAEKPAPGAPAAAPATAPIPDSPEERQTRVPMSMLRQRIAERMVLARQSAAILTTFNEIDMTKVLEWRARHQDRFLGKHGVKLGFMSFFVKAAVEALKAVPEVNARIQGDEIVYNNFYDIGVAVSTEKGLVVPVIRGADRLGFAGIEQAIAELAEKARDRKLSLADISGGTFTISNGGIYGNMMSTPILNPPQSGVLGMHAIKKRAVVVADEIVIRPMMYVALSYDHRLVDGREAVTFLKRVVACIEDPERILLEF
jgi:2-oxoglutarate dehydrogenase E2 component (dihydrolipoamide succinyltransferase)